MKETTVRVILVDDDRLVREALADLMRSRPDLIVAGTAVDASSAVELAASERPAVALVDVKMPGGGPEATRGIIEVSPGTRVIALSAHDDRGSVREMIRAGAIGYIVKGAPSAEIVEAIRRAATGLGHLSPAVATDVVRELAGQLERDARAVDAEQSLRDLVDAALEPGAITPVYQPIVDLGTSRIVGVEALARFMIEPSRPPDAWFRDAAMDGRSAELEIAAIRAEMVAFDDPALGGIYLSVNLSPETIIGSPVLDMLVALPLERIVLEVTEHAAVADYQALAAALAPFRAAGGRLAVDDAGAGFASLRHILLLDPDIIKLDISLTRDVDTDRRKRALAAAFVTFANELGISIVAEGIETATELSELRALGVANGQGYFLRRPAPLRVAVEPIEALA
jgi:EAL domain-containing protein (putative c-di-GMP-specific phosphodiesterase class I)/FixJ family two-component response regulator